MNLKGLISLLLIFIIIGCIPKKEVVKLTPSLSLRGIITNITQGDELVIFRQVMVLLHITL